MAKETFGVTIDKEELMKCLGLNRNEFLRGVPIQVISTGVPFLMAPVQGMAILKRLCLTRSRLRALLERVSVAAVSLFCLEGCAVKTMAGYVFVDN